MLDVLQRHIEAKPLGCVVSQWVSTLSEEEQKAFDKIKENNKNIHLAILHSDLNQQTELPFKLTAFRSHFRGYCTCKK
jgi:hypothetical protein